VKLSWPNRSSSRRPDLKTYAEKHRQFVVGEVPPLLKAAARRGPSAVVADLGCGDGWLVWALDRAGLVSERIFAVDLSPERVERASALSPKAEGIVADASAVHQLPSSSVDGVVCSQLIEHLDDDRLLAPEVARLLRPGGWFYVGSVLRGPRAWWLYRGEHGRLLDPTHVREYESRGEFVEALSHPELELDTVACRPFRFPIVDAVLRVAARTPGVSHEWLSDVYVRRPRLMTLRRLALSPPGYEMIEAVGRRVSPASRTRR
jgi:SAM-dependent methyltransferase